MSERNPVVLLIDTQEFRRASLASFLRTWAKSNEVTLVPVNPNALLESFDESSQCKLMIFNLGGTSVTAHDVAQKLKIMQALAPNAATTVMSDLDGASEIKAALWAGVEGFLPSSMEPELSLQALSFILNGGSFFPPSAMRENTEEPAAAAPPMGGGQTAARRDPKPAPTRQRTIDDDPEGEAQMPSMTERQQEVLVLLRDGEPNKVIARKLGMTEATVKVHVRQIMRKLGASNRTQAAVCAANLLHNEEEIEEAPIHVDESRSSSQHHRPKIEHVHQNGMHM